MILTGNPTHCGFDDCGCCEGLTASTPLRIHNQPGLRAISYRVGRYEDFKQSLVAGLSTSRSVGLQRLTCRDDDDFTIALLDAWAVVLDILTFYQERLANESYLATAREKLSVFELARLVGYRPKPGVAAHTLLAFTIEEPPGLAPGTIPSTQVQTVPTEIVIDAGTQVRSIPGPDEQSQTYETMEKLVARAEWNALRPRLSEPQEVHLFSTEIFLEGTATLLKPGDGLLLFPSAGDAPFFRKVAQVVPYPEENYSQVVLEPASVVGQITEAAPETVQVAAAAKAIPAKAQAYGIGKAAAAAAAATSTGAGAKGQGAFPQVLALRLRAAIFGHNAPLYDSLPDFQKLGVYDFAHYPNWVETTLDKYPGESPGTTQVYLDNAYPAIVTGSWVVLQEEHTSRVYQVRGTAELSKADFTLSAKVTRLTLDTASGLDHFHIRQTTVWAQSEELKLARRPLDTPVSGAVIEVEGIVTGLTKGQKIILGGRLHPAGEELVYETGIIEHSEEHPGADPYTLITLQTALENTYLRHTVAINANVVWASHGETVREILGSGDAAKTFQTFTLRHMPVTYVSSSQPGGAQTTLEIRVNDLLWEEVPSLYGRGPEERVYRTYMDDQGRTMVQFGDGVTGARLPSGRENVVAAYRKGLGLAGLVQPKQLSLLMQQPLGVKGVTNPFAANGADDPEHLEDARENAPLTVLTLERAVSLKDYEDYARAFGGIAKALATWFWNGREKGILITVAGPQGGAVPPQSQVHENLVASLHRAGVPFLPFWVASYRPRTFAVAAKLRVDPGLPAESIISKVQETLRAHFSFAARKFGQAVTLSEVMAVIHRVTGVLAVDIDDLRYSEAAPASQPAAVLPAALPQLGAGDVILAAELLTLEAAPAVIGVMP